MESRQAIDLGEAGGCWELRTLAPSLSEGVSGREMALWVEGSSLGACPADETSCKVSPSTSH